MDTTPASLLVRLRRPDELLPPDQLREQRLAWQRAWADFVELYTPLLYGCARRNGLHRADADDLVAAVLGHLVRKMEEFQYDRRRGRFRDWLAMVLQNKWRELRRRRRAVVLNSADDALARLAVPDDLTTFDESEYRPYLARRALELMQAKFAPATWKACWETVVAGRSSAEVAAELGLSVASVYQARHRVLLRLRQELEGLQD